MEEKTRDLKNMTREALTGFADGALFAFLHAREIGAQEAMLLCLAREFGPVAVKAAALAKVVANVEISAQMVNRENQVSNSVANTLTPTAKIMTGASPRTGITTIRNKNNSHSCT